MKSPTSGERSRKGFLARHSRLFRLYYLIRRGILGQQIEVVIDEEGTLETGAANKLRIGDKEFDMGFRPGRPSVGGDKRALRQNLIKLVEQAEEARVRLYLMRYPARHKFYKLVNPVIEAVARSTKTPLIDLTEVFKPLCPRVDCPEYYLSDNHHPNSLGNRTIAEAIVEELAPRSK